MNKHTTFPFNLTRMAILTVVMLLAGWVISALMKRHIPADPPAKEVASSSAKPAFTSIHDRRLAALQEAPSAASR